MIRITDPDQIRPAHVVFIALLMAVLAGTYLLTNGPVSTDLPEGRQEWRPNSPLRAVVGVLNLNDSQTTSTGTDIKSLVLGVGSALAIGILGITLVLRPGRGEDWDAISTSEPPTQVGGQRGPAADVLFCPGCGTEMPTAPPGRSVRCARCGQTTRVPPHHRNSPPSDATPATQSEIPKSESGGPFKLTPLLTAQLMLLLFVAWSFVSTRWSSAPSLAVSGSMLLGIYVLWAMAIGNGLHPRSAAIGAWSFPVLGGISAVLAVWYYYERTTGALRASYPIGNPNFLAACLLPALLFSMTAVGLGAIGLRRARRATASDVSAAPDRIPRPGVLVALGLAGAAISGWAFHLTRARGPMLGLAVGLLAIPFFATRRIGRIVTAIAAGVLLMVSGFYFAARAGEYSPTGRDATIRVRKLAWKYAGQFIRQRPLTGLGQAGFTCSADALAENDVLTDWPALNATIDQAHNEWIEVLTDLGLVGLGLVGTALGLTFAVATRALPRLGTRRRWTMIALLASLAAIIAEELFNPSLRRAGLPAVYYSIIGLIWALSATPELSWTERVRHSPARWALFPATVMLAIGTGFLAIWDFDGARSFVQIGDALAAEQWDRAEQFARDAAAGQLSPQRRLAAMQRLSETYHALAWADMNRYLRRLQEAAARTDSADQQRRAALAAWAEKDRQLAELHISQGLEANKQLISISKLYGGSGAVCSAFAQLNARLAQMDGKHAEVGQQLGFALECLTRELRRRPYDPDTCFEYARLTAELTGLGRIQEVSFALARPLRYQRTDARTADFMMYLHTAPEFADRFGAVVAKAHAVCSDPQAPLPARPTPTDVAYFAPEILRLASVEPFVRNDYQRSRDLLALAAERYQRLSPRPAFALAAGLAELADSALLASPDEPRAAIGIAESAIQAAPDSAEGRYLVKQLHSQIATYELALGDEAAARARLSRYLLVTGDRTAQDREIGERYARLCRNLVHEKQESYSPKFVRWVQRARELSPQSDLAWRLAADVALTNFGDDVESVRCLRQALRLGADPRLVSEYVTIALTKHPDSAPFLELQKELHAALGTPPPATQPAESQPAETQPVTLPESQPASAPESHQAESQPDTQPAESPASQPPESQPSGTSQPASEPSHP